MGKFISDAEMKKLESSGKVKKNFISDEEMAALEAEKPQMGFVESQVEALPIYGAAAGGILGLSAAPATFGLSSVAGAGLGAGAGQSLRNILKSQFYGEKKGLKEIFTDPTAAILEGATAEMGGQILGKGLQYGAGKIAKELKEGRAIADVLESPKPIDAPEIKIDVPEVKNAQPFEFKAPQTLEELRKWKPEPGAGELLGKARLKEIEQILPDIRTKPLNYHFDMMENPKSMKDLKLTFENLPTKDAQRIAAYNQSMLKESEEQIKNIAQRISATPPRSLNDAGENLMLRVKTRYDETKEMLSPVFEEMRKTGINLTEQNTKDLVRNIGKETNVGKLLNEVYEPVIQNGQAVGQRVKMKLGPNAPRTGLSSNEYKAISAVVEDLNDGASFQEIQKMREFLRKSIDPVNPAASVEIQKVRKVLLNSLEEMTPSQVQPTMKQYAINERALDSVEQIIGGKIETLDKMFAANPEKIINKVFSNPNYKKIVEEYVGKEAIDEMVSSYVNAGVSNSFDTATGFSPVKMRQWLKTNANFINTNVNPAVAKKLQAAADYGYYAKRFLDEVNPSGTAASLKEMIEPRGFVQKLKSGQLTGALTGAVAEKGLGAFEQRQALSKLDEILKGVQTISKPPPSASSILFPMTLQQAPQIGAQAGQTAIMSQQDAVSRRLKNLNKGR